MVRTTLAQHQKQATGSDTPVGKHGVFLSRKSIYHCFDGVYNGYTASRNEHACQDQDRKWVFSAHRVGEKERRRRRRPVGIDSCRIFILVMR